MKRFLSALSLVIFLFVNASAVGQDSEITHVATNGTITGDAPGFYPIESSDVTFSNLPSAGYNFSNWIVNGVDMGTNETITIFPYEPKYEVVAVFVHNGVEHEVTHSATNGTITGDAPGLWLEAYEATFSNLPSAGYSFAGWLVNGIDMG
ncbi:hypothetical protein BVX94_03420, partial [bacterium B17]